MFKMMVINLKDVRKIVMMMMIMMMINVRKYFVVYNLWCILSYLIEKIFTWEEDFDLRPGKALIKYLRMVSKEIGNSNEYDDDSGYS